MKTNMLLVWMLIPIFGCAAQGVLGTIKSILQIPDDPDTFRNTTMLATTKGYPLETHIVQTADGYLLTVHRIPYGKNGQNAGVQQKPVVLILHGLLSSSADWVMNFENQSLGFVLADQGYDVWLGNVRGNVYSRSHITLTPYMPAFWQFSFDEMAQYDLPAFIDYALTTTGQQQLSYVGYSQGSTIGFALFSTQPAYNAKVKLFIALAPVINLKNTKSAIRYLAPFASDIQTIYNMLGQYEFLPNNVVTASIGAYACGLNVVQLVCENVLFAIAGTDSEQLNKTRLGVYLAHSPAGTSSRNMVHFAQLINTDKFQKYDFGAAGNQAAYGQATAPLYYVGNITTPVVLMWGQNDAAADPVDVAILQPQLNSLVLSYEVAYPQFTHLDFIWALNSDPQVYNEMLTLFGSYSG